MRRPTILLLAMLACSPVCVANDAFEENKLAELDTAIRQAISDSKIVGAAVWVERNGVSHHKAFGNRALKPAVEPMTEDTILMWPR